MGTRTHSDIELLRAVYRQVDWDRLARECPGLEAEDIKVFLKRLAAMLPEEEAVAEGGGRTAGDVVIHTDGGSRGNPGPAGYGVVVSDAYGCVLLERGGFIGRATNNEAEYQGLITGLRIARELGAAEITVRSDSQLIVRQINGDYKVRCARLRRLYDEAHSLLAGFNTWRVEHIPREQNDRADELAHRAMDEAGDASRRGDDMP